MIAFRTKSGLLVPESLADAGRAHPGIPLAEWNTLSTRDREYLHGLPMIAGGSINAGYMAINGAMPAAAAPASVTTGATIKTLLQLKPQVRLRPFEWGISLDGSVAGTPGKVEMIEVDVAATVTAFAAADVMPYSDLNGPANTSGTSGTPLNLGTTHSGYTSSGEGTVTASRLFDGELIAPTSQYVKQFPLDREPHLTVAKFTRIRVTFAVAINAYCYVVFEPAST